MKFKIFLLTLFIILNLNADWKRDVKKYFSRINDYEGAINYLSKNYNKENIGEKKQISAILAFSYRQMENQESEKLWIDEYFNNYKEEQTTFGFLKDSINIKVTDYINQWKSKYPIILRSELITKKESLYNKRPQGVEILMNLINSSNYKILKDNKIIKSGLLNKGDNIIELISGDISKCIGLNKFELNLNIGDVTVKKEIIVEIKLVAPENILLKDSKLVFKDKPFKDEYVLKKTITKKKYFDKKHFFKKSLLLTGSGIALFTTNHFALYNKVSNSNFSLNSGPYYRGAYNSLKVISIGLFVKGVIKFAKSFKTEIIEKEKKEYDKSAAAYNEFLRKAIVTIEKNVKILINFEIKKL